MSITTESKKAHPVIKFGILLGFLAVIVGWLFILGSGSANAATEPKPVNLMEVGQKFVTTVHNGGDLATAASKARDEALTIIAPKPHRAIGTTKIAHGALVRPVQPQHLPAPSLERIVLNALPDSIPQMVIGAGDNIANTVLSAANGAPTRLPAPTERITKSASLIKQINGTIDLFTNKYLKADARGCNESGRVAQIECAMHIVDKNAPTDGPKVPNTVLIARYGVNLHSIDAKGRICGGYIAATNYCGGQMQLSTIAVDALAGNKKATTAQWVFVIGHENGHHRQDVYVTKRTGNPLAFRDMTEKTKGAAEAAENNADEVGGYVVQSAISHHDLKTADMESARVAIRNSGNKGVEGDTHATSGMRLALAYHGGQYFLNGRNVPQYSFAA